MQLPILSLITFLPILGMIIILALPKSQTKVIKSFTLLITGVQVILAVFIMANYNYAMGGIFEEATFQFIEKWRWIDIDGFSWLGKIIIKPCPSTNIISYQTGLDVINQFSGLKAFN